MTTRRRAIAAAFAVTMAFVAPVAFLPAASHAAAYRYWSYWLGSEGDWTFANVGPAFRIPADGTLEGWRFSVSGVQGNQAPSFASDFDAVCGGTPPEDGRKRVAVVVDPGGPDDAPEGELSPGAWALCVVAEPRATGYEVLRAAATVRTERGLICGIGGYPSRGCAEVVADPSPTPTATKSPKPSPKPTRAPDPTPAPDPTATSTSPDVAVSSQSPDPQASAETSAPRASASPTASPSPTATPTPTPSTPTPTPSYSMLTAPLQDPPSDSGIGGALVAGIAVVGIAGLGGAAILRMRRSA
jgi:hypothetical protein